MKRYDFMFFVILYVAIISFALLMAAAHLSNWTLATFGLLGIAAVSHVCYWDYVAERDGTK